MIPDRPINENEIEYTGPYSIIHTETGIQKLHSGVITFPDSVSVEEDRISVQEGSIQEVSLGGFEFHSQEKFFASIGYASIKEIRDGEDNVIWKNRYYD